MTRLYSDGLGATTGHAFSLYYPIWMSGRAWYVSYATGTDGASPRGLDRADPLKTLAQAVANAAAGDVVVLLESHDETITTKVTIGKALRIIGEGRAAGIPIAALTCEVTEDEGIEITADWVDIYNVKFKTPTITGVGLYISVEANHVTFDSLYCEHGEHAAAGGIQQLSAQTHLTIRNSSFLSVAESLDTRPAEAVIAAGSYMILDGVTFDAGEYGFSGSSGRNAFDGNGAAQTHVRIENVSLLHGADMLLHGSTTGWVNVGTHTGGARVTWG